MFTDHIAWHITNKVKSMLHLHLWTRQSWYAYFLKYVVPFYSHQLQNCIFSLVNPFWKDGDTVYGNTSDMMRNVRQNNCVTIETYKWNSVDHLTWWDHRRLSAGLVISLMVTFYHQWKHWKRGQMYLNIGNCNQWTEAASNVEEALYLFVIALQFYKYLSIVGKFSLLKSEMKTKYYFASYKVFSKKLNTFAIFRVKCTNMGVDCNTRKGKH